MKKMLRDKGVQVFYGENLTIQEFRTLEEQFRDSLQQGDIGIVSFSGHAYTYNNATRLVMLTDVEQREEDNTINVVRLNIRLTQRRCACPRTSTSDVAISQSHRMKRRGTEANVFLMDCCRTLKYNRGAGGAATPSENQAPAKQTNTVYVYATELGHPASDGDGEHGKGTVKGTKRGYCCPCASTASKAIR